MNYHIPILSVLIGVSTNQRIQNSQLLAMYSTHKYYTDEKQNKTKRNNIVSLLCLYFQGMYRCIIILIAKQY